MFQLKLTHLWKECKGWPFYLFFSFVFFGPSISISCQLVLIFPLLCSSANCFIYLATYFFFLDVQDVVLFNFPLQFHWSYLHSTRLLWRWLTYYEYLEDVMHFTEKTMIFFSFLMKFIALILWIKHQLFQTFDLFVFISSGFLDISQSSECLNYFFD